MAPATCLSPGRRRASCLSPLGLACRVCALSLVHSGDEATCPRCGWHLARHHGIWRVPGDGAPAGFTASRREHLADIASRHFWFPPRRRLLATRLDLFCQPFSSAIELGCGTGDFLPELSRRAGRVLGVDGYVDSLETARHSCPRAELLAADLDRGLPLAPAQFDLAVALDVLEHVAADTLLEEIRRVTLPRATLLLAVPALPALWSALDDAARHRLRYRRRTLEPCLAAHGFSLLSTTYYQMILLPLVFVARRLGGGALARFERRPPAVVGRVLGAINDFEVRSFGRWSLPWGSSLVATAVRTG